MGLCVRECYYKPIGSRVQRYFGVRHQTEIKRQELAPDPATDSLCDHGQVTEDVTDSAMRDWTGRSFPTLPLGLEIKQFLQSARCKELL